MIIIMFSPGGDNRGRDSVNSVSSISGSFTSDGDLQPKINEHKLHYQNIHGHQYSTSNQN